MRSYAASEWTILRKVRIPNALPYFFTAMKIATTLSLIGAIVGGNFGGANSVLGRPIVNGAGARTPVTGGLMLNRAAARKLHVTWCVILSGAATGILFYLVFVLAERLLI